MFGNGISDLFKGLDLKNLDFVGLANKLVNLVPDGQGKKAMNLAMGVAKNGGSPKDVKKALEDMIPGAKEKLAGNQIWNNIPDDKAAIPTYGKNVAMQFNIFKNDNK